MRMQCKRELGASGAILAKSHDLHGLSNPTIARILALADELDATGHHEELSAIISRRERVSEATVDAILNRDRIAQRVRAETIESGVRGAIDEGRRALWQVRQEEVA